MRTESPKEYYEKPFSRLGQHVARIIPSFLRLGHRGRKDTRAFIRSAGEENSPYIKKLFRGLHRISFDQKAEWLTKVRSLRADEESGLQSSYNLTPLDMLTLVKGKRIRNLRRKLRFTPRATPEPLPPSKPAEELRLEDR